MLVRGTGTGADALMRRVRDLAQQSSVPAEEMAVDDTCALSEGVPHPTSTREKRRRTEPTTEETGTGREDNITTFLQSSEDEVEDVGDLTTTAGITVYDANLLFPRRNMSAPYVYLSYRGPDTKASLVHPTYWFLTEVLGIHAFLDSEQNCWGHDMQLSLLQAAYESSHAILFLSPGYRKSRFCVKELNTFLKRRSRHQRAGDDDDPLKIIPILWQLPDLEGYSPALKQITWMKKEHCSPSNYLLFFIWPFLFQEFKRKPATTTFLERMFARYTSSVNDRHSLDYAYSRPLPAYTYKSQILDSNDETLTPATISVRPQNRLEFTGGRFKCAFAVWKHYVLVVGGVNVDGNVLEAVDRFDIRKHEWQEIARLKKARSECSVIVSGDTLYVFGGEGADGMATNNCEIFGLSDHAGFHEARELLLLPEKRKLLLVANDNSNQIIYCIGGCASPVSLNVFYLNTRTGQFQRLPQTNAGHLHGFAFVLGSKLYVVGGVDAAGQHPLPEAYSLSPPDASWTILPSVGNTLSVDYSENDSVIVWRDDGSSSVFQKDGRRRAGPILPFTTMLNEDDTPVHVGPLWVRNVWPPQIWKPSLSKSPYIFLSHRGPETKRSFMLPTSWFLRNKLEVKDTIIDPCVFLDQEDMELGHTQQIELLSAAYECTIALVVLSPGFRRSKYCVQELNSFMERRKHGSVEVLPVLWRMDEVDLAGYHEDVRQIIWFESEETDGETAFLLHRLWPKLSTKFGRRFSYPQLQSFLVEYVQIHQHEPETVTPAMLDLLRIVEAAAPTCVLS